MQPYFLPYIGYWQLLNTVDKFVVYDNIEYTKKGWINRNRFLQNGQEQLFTIPISKGSDTLDICERTISSDFNRAQLISKFENAYRKAPNFKGAFPVIKAIINNKTHDLFDYLFASIQNTALYIGIDTSKLLISSELDIDHALKAEDKVLAICHSLGAQEYINPIGGLSMYDKARFSKHNIELKFIQSQLVEYQQLNTTFTPWLSIVDIMMCNESSAIKKMLDSFTFQ